MSLVAQMDPDQIYGLVIVIAFILGIGALAAIMGS
jgi:hypothetical protein